MWFSVVIPSYNSRDGLESLLRSLDRQRVDPDTSFEVVVVDDGSTDGTADLVHRLDLSLDLRYVFKPRTPSSGRAAARNTGIGAATGDVVIFVDADQVVPPRFVAEHAAYHRRSSALAVVGPRGNVGTVACDLAMQDPPAETVHVGDVDSRESAFAVLGHNLDSIAAGWHFFFTCNASAGRAHLLAIGGFDERFNGWGLEDTDLAYRLRKRGLKFAYNPAAVSFHLQKQPWTQEMYAEWRANLVYFTGKHRSPDAAAQWMLDRSYSFDPDVKDLSWLESFLRFEYAARAMEGRYQGAESPELIEVTAGNRDEVLATVAERAQQSPLLVLDHFADRELAAVVQTMPASRRTLYFARPAGDRARILRTYPPSGVSGAGRWAA